MARTFLRRIRGLRRARSLCLVITGPLRVLVGAFCFSRGRAGLQSGKAHTRPCPVQRGRKSGYAPVGMTIHLGDNTWRSQTKLSSRPERTRISCHAALDKAAYAPFCKGKAHEVHQRHQVPQEIRGSVVEGPAVAFFPLLTRY